MIGIGQMRHVMTIQNEVVTVDATGKRITTWNGTETVWADVVPVTRQEEFQYSALDVHATYKIYLRYTPTLRPRSRLLWGSKVLHVTRVKNLGERNTKLEVIAWLQE